MEQSPDEKLAHVAFTMPEPLYRRLKVYAIEHDTSARRILTDIITNFCEKLEPMDMVPDEPA